MKSKMKKNCKCGLPNCPTCDHDGQRTLWFEEIRKKLVKELFGIKNNSKNP